MPAPQPYGVPAHGQDQTGCPAGRVAGTGLPSAWAGDAGAAGVSACLEVLRARVIRTLREHVSDNGRCPACGGAA